MFYKKVLFLVAVATATATATATAQPSSAKCELMMINYRKPTLEVIYSKSGRYIARIEPSSYVNEERRNPSAFLYEKNKKGNRYILKAEYMLKNENFPYHSILSDKGFMLTAGEKNQRPNIDEVFIYDSNGTLVNTLRGSEIFSEKELNESIKRYNLIPNCTPVEPWVCWSFAPKISSNGMVKFIDTLDRIVEIDTHTGKIHKSDQIDRCSMFAEQAQKGFGK